MTDARLQNAVARMDHFPDEALYARHDPAFALLSASAADEAGLRLLDRVPVLAELRYDVGRQVVGLVSAEALATGALALASETRRRADSPAAGSRMPLEALLSELAGAARGEDGLGRAWRDVLEARPNLQSLLVFAADRLARAAVRADDRLAGHLELLRATALENVERGAAAELALERHRAGR